MTTDLSAHFTAVASRVVGRNADRLLEYGHDEQVSRAVTALAKLHARHPLRPAPASEWLSLAGFGEVPVMFTAGPERTRYVLLGDACAALGMAPEVGETWASAERHRAVIEQREADEETGVLGWEYLNDQVSLDVWFTTRRIHSSAPDALVGVDYGEWLIADHRLPLLILESPWAHEFSENIVALAQQGFTNVFADQLSEVSKDFSDNDISEDGARR